MEKVKITVKDRKPITLFYENGKLIPSGVFSLPSCVLTGTEEEAEAFIKGVRFALDWWLSEYKIEKAEE